MTRVLNSYRREGVVVGLNAVLNAGVTVGDTVSGGVELGIVEGTFEGEELDFGDDAVVGNVLRMDAG